MELPKIEEGKGPKSDPKNEPKMAHFRVGFWPQPHHFSGILGVRRRLRGDAPLVHERFWTRFGPDLAKVSKVAQNDQNQDPRFLDT